MSLESHVPGSPFYSGEALTVPPATHRTTDRPYRSRPRQPWEPISHDTDPLNRARRLTRVDLDVALHITGEPCHGCGERARLSGGDGCRCATSGTDLEKRCLDAADRVRLAGDPWRHNPAAQPQQEGAV